MTALQGTNSDLALRNRLKLDKVIGLGAFARVYGATLDGEAVALKVLLPQHTMPSCIGLKLFLREAQCMRNFADLHRNILRCMTVLQLPADFPGLVGVYNGKPTWAMVLELATSGSLANLVQRQMVAPYSKLYSDAQALMWLGQVADALAALHNAHPQIIHRDLKHENVLLTRSPDGTLQAKLADFGLHVRVDKDDTSRRTIVRRRSSSNLLQVALNASTAQSAGGAGGALPSLAAVSTASLTCSAGTATQSAALEDRDACGSASGEAALTNAPATLLAARSTKQPIFYEVETDGGLTHYERPSRGRQPPSGLPPQDSHPSSDPFLVATNQGLLPIRLIAPSLASSMRSSICCTYSNANGHALPSPLVLVPQGCVSAPTEPTQQPRATPSSRLKHSYSNDAQSTHNHCNNHSGAARASLDLDPAGDDRVGPIAAPLAASTALASGHNCHAISLNRPATGPPPAASTLSRSFTGATCASSGRASAAASDNCRTGQPPVLVLPSSGGDVGHTLAQHQLSTVLEQLSPSSSLPRLVQHAKSATPRHGQNALMACGVVEESNERHTTNALWPGGQENGAYMEVECIDSLLKDGSKAGNIDSGDDTGSQARQGEDTQRAAVGKQPESSPGVLPSVGVAATVSVGVVEAGQTSAVAGGQMADELSRCKPPGSVQKLSRHLFQRVSMGESARTSMPGSRPDSIATMVRLTLGINACDLDHLVPVYQLTGATGSATYMAPEMVERHPYNEKVDVFSFGVLMYELLGRTLLVHTHVGIKVPELPRILHSTDEYAAAVAGGYRPQRLRSVPPAAWSLLEACWHADPLERPSMEQVVDRIRELQRQAEAEALDAGPKAACGCVIC